ncbi:hypothetical protein [Algoriphagus sediminis]|uniref:Uncharacterized protein n=1 Tax=Algoriphagus sediminis TaxID=3057113 RepID=A0ABT7Y9D5_9BACT|nr:hypothetical protein [Algoriphagus sediminis]MDN3203124.1 hypothetical protein [Algoriphagus sediminis]
MPNPHFIAKYNDPIFHQIKTSFNNRSDDYPVLMLPVRLETRFMKYSRVVPALTPSHVKVQDIIQDIYKLSFDIQLYFDVPEDPENPDRIKFFSDSEKPKHKSKLLGFRDSTYGIISKIEKIPELQRMDKSVLRDAGKDLAFIGDSVPEMTGLKSNRNFLITAINSLISKIDNIKAPSLKVPNIGKDYLSLLGELQKSIEKIFVVTKVNAKTLEPELEKIDTILGEIDKLAESPYFEATDATIKKIESQITFIKKQHKSGNVRLQDFKNGFTGEKDLRAEEHALRKKINDLQKKIKETHAPALEANKQLKKFPVSQLHAMITKLTRLLMALNRKKLSSKTYLSQQKSIVNQLKQIEAKAKIPLDGSVEEMNKMKSSYGSLKNQAVSYQKRASKIPLINPTEKRSMTILNNSITQLLNSLRELEPGRIKLDTQILGTEALKRSAIAGFNTRNTMITARNRIKKPTTDHKKQLEVLKKELAEVQKKIETSASKTPILPRSQMNKVKSSYFSLRDQVNNILEANPLPSAQETKEQTDEMLSRIENSILDQLTDVNDPKDRFHSVLKDRVVFVPKTVEVNELWVRIYPDDVAIDNHDERITKEEESIAKDFYYEVYRNTGSARDEAKIGAWRAAATSLGVRRGAYIIKAMEPDEVKSDKVPVIQNELKEFFFESLDLKGKEFPVRDPGDWLKETKKRFNSSAERIKKILKSNKFSPCLENKATLDEGLEYLRLLLDHLKKLAMSSKDRLIIEEAKSLAEMVNKSGKIIYEYYQNNLESLNLPFKPELTFPKSPKIEIKEKSWDKGATTDALPDRFVVVTKRGGHYQHVVTGKLIPNPLPIGLDPSKDQVEGFKHLPNGDLEIPDKIKWMFDFEEAVEAGMAVKIPLDADDLANGFDFVMAYGVQDTTANEGQKKIDALFNGHLYSDGGLEFLPTGTATNNTDQVKSPYKTLDNDLDGVFETFFGQEKLDHPNSFIDDFELSITDGQFFKEGLGLPKDLTDNIRNHTKKDICEGRAMNRALYYSTLNYFFSVLAPELFNNTDKIETMLFMLHHVSAFGTLPIFRVDSQPYGVTPVSPIKQFRISGTTKKGSEGSYLKNLSWFLKQTKAAFLNDKKVEPALSVTSGKYSKDPQAEFMRVLGLEPYSKEFFFRFGANAANRWLEPETEGNEEHKINWDNISKVYSPSELAKTYSQLLVGLGHKSTSTQTAAISKTGVYKNRYNEGNFVLGDLVQDPSLSKEGLVETDKGSNYLEWLKTQNTLAAATNLTFEDLPKVNIDGENKTQYTILLTLVRGALVYEKSRSFADKALDVIKDLDVPTLERLVSSHLDLISYRLDAWLTGLSDFRLRELRKKKATGTYLGAYGFVHDLKPEVNDDKISEVSNPPEGLESPNGNSIKRRDSNQGFIHGQSLNHAVTAAVLRAGHNSLIGKGENENALAINLTSQRVRKALHLLEGVGNGQETGAMLGYMFERALHEKYKTESGEPLEMDVYIYRLRRKFPTYSDADVDPTKVAQSESLKAANVVDGLAMIDYFQTKAKGIPNYDEDKTLVDNLVVVNNNSVSFNGAPWDLAQQLPNPSNPPQGSTPNLERKKLRAIIHEIDNMADALDALGDLVTAEGVYQLVRGNHVRASAVFNAIAEGKVPLDPEIIRSMREGSMVTHRAIVQIPKITNTDSPWTGVDPSPRSVMEPSLNNWLAAKIGDPTKISWMLSHGNSESPMTLVDLNMQPIDLVLLITTGGEESQEELNARCVDFLKSLHPGEDGDIEIKFNTSAASGDLSFGETISLIQHLGKLIGSARSSDARDYKIPEDESNFGPTAPGIDTTELKGRITQALTEYSSILDSLAPFEMGKTSYSESEETLAVNSLITLAGWGFAGYYPSDREENILGMAQRLIAAKGKMAENIAFAEEGLAALEFEPDHGKWINFSVEFGTKFFGSGFKVMTHVTVSNHSNLNDQLNMPWSEGPLRHHDENFLQDWLSSVSLVRDRLSNVDSIGFLTEIFGTETISFKPLQLPFDPSNQPPVAEREYWLGAEYPDSYQPEGDRLSLLIFEKENLQGQACGLVLDEWMEIIPQKNQTTGIAFHYNQPDSRAPQNLLLAVPPEKRGKWDFEELGLCVEEAFELAKIRAVEPDQLDESMYAQVLPVTSALAFGDTEFAKRLAQDKPEGADLDELEDEETKLGYFIDYTHLNTGHEPEEE